MERHRAVREERLHLGHEQVALFEKRAHLQLVAFEFTALVTGSSMQFASFVIYVHTCTPPGRLTDESIRTASCREFASTFHRRGCTWNA